MIPIEIELENFMSYREPAVLNLSAVHLACITGENGAGKSTLLDAITWALFGNCRAPSRDDVINRRAVKDNDAARVRLDFELEGNRYRVLRVQPPNKTGLLEFQLSTGDGQWKSLTEATKSATQQQLDELLRMNYETFTNASFLLQGQADEFTVKTPGERKRILGDLLGVSHWDRYRERASQERRDADKEVAALDGRLQDVDAELGQEPLRQERLKTARATHNAARLQRETQALLVSSIQTYEAAVRQHQALVDSLANNLAQTRSGLTRLRQTRAQRQTELETLQTTLDQAVDIENRFAEWQAATAELAALDEKSRRWNQLNNQRQQAQLVVERERSRLQQMRTELQQRQQEAAAREIQLQTLERDLEAGRSQVAALRRQLDARETLRALLGERQGELGSLNQEQAHLKDEMEKMKERQERLQREESGRCPLCGQELTLDHRAAVIAEIQEEGGKLGDRYRANQQALTACQQELKDVQQQLQALTPVERDLRAAEKLETTLHTQVEQNSQLLAQWKDQDAGRLAEVERQLAENTFAADSQAEIATRDADLASLDYDPELHAQARARAEELAPAQQQHQTLNQARAAHKPQAAALQDLDAQIDEQEQRVAELEQQHQQALSDVQKLGPGPDTDLATAERELNRLREEEVLASKAVGAAEQALQALDTLRQQREVLVKSRRQITHNVALLQQLERAFGRNGVQALLIEHALPAIENSANELLDRLTNGEMRVTFSTQRQLKSTDALAETLDIDIADNAGRRPYEMYSGGEAFRVNFAIRIALSQLLAQRAGARLQTLVIDEGFGSQDPEGRQRLIEAINEIKDDFARVLVITHIDELRDAFPLRIQVNKAAGGSTVALV